MPAEAATHKGLLAIVQRHEIMGAELGELIDLAEVESKQRRELIQPIRVIHDWLGQQNRLEGRRSGRILKVVAVGLLGQEGILLRLGRRRSSSTQALQQL